MRTADGAKHTPPLLSRSFATAGSRRRAEGQPKPDASNLRRHASTNGQYNQVVTSPSVVARLVPVIAHAVAVFGDEQKATHWLSTPLLFLENRAPLDLLVTDEGIELVERTLTRIEHNIPS